MSVFGAAAFLLAGSTGGSFSSSDLPSPEVLPKPFSSDSIVGFSVNSSIVQITIPSDLSANSTMPKAVIVSACNLCLLISCVTPMIPELSVVKSNAFAISPPAIKACAKYKLPLAVE